MVFKEKDSQMELFIKYPNEVQQELLNQLLQTAQYTYYGKMYDFSNIRNYEQFRSKVPVVRYEEMEPFIERTRCGEQNVFWPTPIQVGLQKVVELQMPKANSYL